MEIIQIRVDDRGICHPVQMNSGFRFVGSGTVQPNTVKDEMVCAMIGVV